MNATTIVKILQSSQGRDFKTVKNSLNYLEMAHTVEIKTKRHWLLYTLVSHGESGQLLTGFSLCS